ncbi:MAG: GTP cyclohydrolase II [Myxococcales bacterium]|nr:GTP cyclohydrolase II [Myxococcales bacterium]
MQLHEAPSPPARPVVRFAAEARLPSRYGDFRVLAFECQDDGLDYGVMARGDLEGAENVPVRLHSECFTGDVMGSLKCDCRDQLEAALTCVGKAERGAVLYLPQEGRGIGLANKIRAYALQDKGLDTVEANLALGFPDDLRRYDVAAEILRQLGIRSVALLTNNPTKLLGVARAGIPVASHIPLHTEPNAHNAFYLDTKKKKSGHRL